jgi:hypothetical protein
MLISLVKSIDSNILVQVFTLKEVYPVSCTLAINTQPSHAMSVNS